MECNQMHVVILFPQSLIWNSQWIIYFELIYCDYVYFVDNVNVKYDIKSFYELFGDQNCS